MIVHNISTQTTPFVGRLKELESIANLLRDPACRLLTLAGPGGMGKTRLALEAVRQISLPYDIYFVSLQPLTSPDFIFPTIAEVLQFQFHSGDEPQQQLLDHLREKSLLLILDNFEHLLESAPLLSEMLAAVPGLHLLVTSRERLNLREEWVLDVHGLAYPPDESPIEDFDAVRLFLLHACRVRSDFALTGRQKSAVSRICRIVEGMPLGIELAAARVRALSCEAIADEMEHSLDILETSARNVEARHQSMRAAFNPTWERLSDEERSVFRKLSVFRGGFTREAAEYVAQAALPLLASLVDKSLVRSQLNGRYDLHELLRQYSAEHLNQLPEEYQRTCDLHCAYFAALLDQQWARLNGRDPKTALEVIDADIENIRAGWGRAVAKRNAEAIDQSLDSLWYFFDAHCWFDEGAKTLSNAAKALADDTGDPKTRLIYARILARAGFFCSITMQLKRARILIEESLTILRALDAPRELAFTLQKLADVAAKEEDTAASNQLLQESLRICRDIGDQSGAAWSLYQLGVNTYYLDNYMEAQQFCQEGIALYTEIGNASGLASCLSIEGWCSYFLESFTEAKQLFRDQIVLSDQAGNRWDMMHGRLGLGLTMIALGEYSESLTPLCDGLSRALEIGVETVPAIPMVLVEVIAEVAALLANRGEKIRAVALLYVVLHQHHWSMRPGIENRAHRLFSQLQTGIPSDTFLAAVEQGKTLSVKSVAVALLPQLQAMLKGLQTHPIQPAHDLLNKREIEVLRLVAEGMNNREIAHQLFITVGTVKWYNNEIFHKLNVKSRGKAVTRGRELGFIP